MSAEVEIYEIPGNIPAIVAFYPGEKKIEAASKGTELEIARLLGRPEITNLGSNVKDDGILATCQAEHVPYGSKLLSDAAAYNAMRKIEKLRSITRDEKKRK